MTDHNEASEGFMNFGWTPTPITVEFTMEEVDPEVVNLLWGAKPGTPIKDATQAGHSVEMTIPIKRTFWQWLLRRPVQYRRILIPNARVNVKSEEPK